MIFILEMVYYSTALHVLYATNCCLLVWYEKFQLEKKHSMNTDELSYLL